MPYICKVVENLHMLWMGTWTCHHSVPPLSLVKLLEANLEFWVTATPQPVGLCSVWGYGPTPNRSEINVIHMQGGWEPSYAVDGHMDLSSLSPPTLIRQAFGSQAWILGNCQATICRVVWCLRLWTHSKQIPHQCHIYARCLRTFICCGWAHGPVLTH
jgi:hypothetical protein